MKQPNISDYSEMPCKSIIAENINAVRKGRELTAPLSYLNRSCEFRKKYEMIVGDINPSTDHWKAYLKSDKYKAYQKAYRKSDKYKAYRKTYQKAYRKSDKYKAYQKAYQKAYHQRKIKGKLE